ncbi:MAG: DUF2846 domain-containing protein [Chloroflexi bacterium]|nr:DUF2846 domain-containing protein [Chloroflexota bacterium]
MPRSSRIAELLLIPLAVPLFAQPVVFQGLQVRFSRSPSDRRMVEKSAQLILDDSARRLLVKSPDRPLDVKYEDVTDVILDQRFNWCYIEYKRPDGSLAPEVLRAENSWAALGEKLKNTLGNRVRVSETREGLSIEKATLKDRDSSHSLTVDKANRPIPEVKPDKALVVVACLPLAARYAGKSNQFKLHANDRVVAVNKMGTYSFAYLDPGEYLLATQAENANGMKVKLDAGKDYYLLQDVYFGAWKGRTSLSMHEKKVVMYEVGGSYYADWKRK